MRPNRLKRMWREGRPAVCCWVSAADPYTVEALAHLGFDALVIDMQHGMGITPERAVACLQAVSGTETVPLVRVPWNRPEHIQYVLDAGAYGVIVPLVNTGGEAEAAGRACRYPPLGYRSVGPNRARLYAGPDYLEHANEEVVCLVMVETARAVQNLEEIARAPGVDGFYIGPADLAISLGLDPLGPYDERHERACLEVLRVAREHGLVAGVHAAGPEEALRRFEQGFLFCPIAGDIGLVVAGARDALARAGRGGGPAGRGPYG